MFNAYDLVDHRVIYAEQVESKELLKDKQLVCPICHKSVIFKHKDDGVKVAHFAHERKADCPYSEDKDYNHEWHIRMQSYFPSINREVWFKDDDDRVFRADVFLPKTDYVSRVFNNDVIIPKCDTVLVDTVLEFQHSPISDEDFISRTEFHIKNGRRIVWLFDESETNPQPDHLGRFKGTSMRYEDTVSSKIDIDDWTYFTKIPANPYEQICFQWLRNPRRVLEKLAPLELVDERLVICVYTGREGDTFHRLQHKKHVDDKTFVIFSLHAINMNDQMNVEEFFIPENNWREQPPHYDWFMWFRRSTYKIRYEKSMQEYREAEAERINQRQQPKSIFDNPNKRKFRF